MTTPEEQINYWKARCAHVEKELKAAQINLDNQIAATLKAQADCSMWKQKALTAEQMIREMNQ